MTPARKRGGGGGASRRGKGRARHESSAGGVVVRLHDGRPLFLVIRDSYDHWGFPKGHVEAGERADIAALREVMEEAGVQDVTVVGPIATIEWWFRLHGDLIHKNCQYFLMQTAVESTRPQESEGISECRWVTIEDARALIKYSNARDVLQRAYEMVVVRPTITVPATG